MFRNLVYYIMSLFGLEQSVRLEAAYLKHSENVFSQHTEALLPFQQSDSEWQQRVRPKKCQA